MCKSILSVKPNSRFASFSCWLSYMPLCLSFILPVGLYIFINSILFCIVARSLLCGKTGQQLRSTQVAESQRLSRFFIALSCFVVLGLTWIFGFFVIGPVRLLFQILFCTFATLTGFLIFTLYIVTSKAKRTCWSSKSTSLWYFSLQIVSNFSRRFEISWYSIDLFANFVIIICFSC